MELTRASGANAFMTTEGDEVLSPFARNYLAGLLVHARASAVFTTPTINGYKRYRPYSLAPDRVIWGKENRGALLRVVGGPRDPDTRIENRIGEPAANPYLYFASQVYSGLDGIERRMPMTRSADTPYEAKADFLPRTLDEALQHLKVNKALRDGFGNRKPELGRGRANDLHDLCDHLRSGQPGGLHQHLLGDLAQAAVAPVH